MLLLPPKASTNCWENRSAASSIASPGSASASSRPGVFSLNALMSAVKTR